MNLKGKRLLLVSGAGPSSSPTADALRGDAVAEVRIFDNFSRGHEENLVEARRDPRLTILMGGGDLLQPDLLAAAMEGTDGAPVRLRVDGDEWKCAASGASYLAAGGVLRPQA